MLPPVAWQLPSDVTRFGMRLEGEGLGRWQRAPHLSSVPAGPEAGGDDRATPGSCVWQPVSTVTLRLEMRGPCTCTWCVRALQVPVSSG